MILSDLKIKEGLDDGKIIIDPFNEKALNPTSYDVTLDATLGMYVPHKHWKSKLDWLSKYMGFNSMYFLLLILQFFMLIRIKSKNDTNPNEFYTFDMPDKGMWIIPGFFYLYSTVERIGSNHYSSEIKSKSSIARSSLMIHLVASWVDVGFVGNVTLEMYSIVLVRVQPYMPIGQIIFHSILGEVGETYDKKPNSKYHNQKGVTASKMYKNDI